MNFKIQVMMYFALLQIALSLGEKSSLPCKGIGWIGYTI